MHYGNFLLLTLSHLSLLPSWPDAASEQIFHSLARLGRLSQTTPPRIALQGGRGLLVP